MTVVLLPSVLLGPVAVEPLARALLERGHDVRVVDPGTPRSAAELSDRYRAGLTGRGAAVLVPHSSAGLFAPGLLAEPGVRGAVFVDAQLPAAATSDPAATGAGQVPLVPVGLRPSIPVDADGAPLAWPFWWAPDDVVGLYPDDRFRAEVERRAPPPAASLLSDTVTVPSVGASRGGYVAFGDTYRDDRDRARSLGWPTRRLDGRHLHLTVDPAGVADAVIDVATRAGLV